MKKLLSLLVVLALVLSMVPTVFAEESTESIFTLQPEDLQAAVGARIMFGVAVKGEVASYRWQYRTATGSKWYNATASNYPSGYNEAELIFKATAARDGMHYRCKVTMADGSVHYSDEATITLKQIITSHPTDIIIIQGEPVELNVEAVDAVSYQWKYSTNKKNWSTCTKGTSYVDFDTPTLKWTAKARNTPDIYYRCHIVGEDGYTYYSNYAHVHYQPKMINTQPSDVTVAAVNDKATYTVETVSGYDLTYLWQYRAAGSEKWNKGSSSLTPGFDTNSITVTAKAARNGMSYRCMITNNANGDVYYTEPAYLYIGTPVNITTNPENASVDLDQTATFQAAADVADATCQWYVQLPGTTAWTAIDGATSTTLEVVGTDANNGASYKAKFTYNGIVKETTAAVLTVNTNVVTALNPDSIPGTATTTVIPAGATRTYTTMAGGCNMIIESANATVTYNGETYAPVDGVVTVPLAFVNPRLGTQNTLEITNTGAEATAFTAKFEYPLGHMENPEVIADITSFSAPQAEGDSDGYNMVWTSDVDGALKLFFMSDVDAVANATIMVGYTQYSYPDEAYMGGIIVPVAKGDVVSFNLAAAQTSGEGADYSVSYPAATIEASAQILDGTAEAPFELNPQNIPDTVDTMKIPAAATQTYVVNAGGCNMIIESENAAVSYNGVDYTPVDGVITIALENVNPRLGTGNIVTITNNGTEAATFEVKFEYPLGTFENPEVVAEPGYLAAEVAEGDFDGYYYSFTAPEDGKLTLKLYKGWDFLSEMVVTCNSVQKVMSLDGTFDANDEFAPGVLTFDAKAGDEYVFQLIAVENYETDEIGDFVLDEDGNKVVLGQYPAAYVSAELAFESGSENYPYLVEFMDLPANVTASNKQAAGEEVYYLASQADVMITINANVTVNYNGETYEAVDGVVTFDLDSAAEDSCLFSVTNNGTSEAAMSFKVENLLGSWENPAVLQEGENVATVKADSWSGYYFTFTAPSKGVLTIAVSGTNGWSYQLNNLTTSEYGDRQNSVDGNYVASLNLLDGDEIQLNVNTFAGEDAATPAGEITVIMTFETLGDVEIEQPLPEIPEDGEA